MVWYSYIFKNIPQIVVIHTIKDFSIVNEAEVDFFFGIPLLSAPLPPTYLVLIIKKDDISC